MHHKARPRIARIEHGAGQSYQSGHGSYAGGNGCEAVSLFLMPNQYSADLWQSRYPEAQVEIVGSPRLDTLPARDTNPGPTVAISFHWDCYLLGETRSAVDHYRSVLPELAERFTVMGHGHPRAFEPGRLARIYRRAGIEQETSFDEVCRKADIYVCDNSSSLFEFAATGRPVVVLNAPWYRRNVDFGLRFWDAADVGIQVDQPGQLIAAIERAVQDPPQQRHKRERALAQVYAYRSGAAKRAAEILGAWVSKEDPT